MTLGYFSQFSELKDDVSVVDVLNELFEGIRDIERELARIDRSLAGTEDEKEQRQLLKRQGELHDEMDRLDGWKVENSIDTVLSKLGFNESRRTIPISQLSGGWRNRAALARTLLTKPDVLLMDEPTNYLDLTSTQVMERALIHFPGAIIVVSHDRFFIDKVATRLLVFSEKGKLTQANGGWTTWAGKRVNQ